MSCPEPAGLVCDRQAAHNCFVTITYLNGTILQADVLSHGENAICALAAGSTDVRTFQRIHGVWISEEIEPVTIRFGWQTVGATPAACADDYVCAKQLAAHLIHTLLTGYDPREADGTATASARGPRLIKRSRCREIIQ